MSVTEALMEPGGFTVPLRIGTPWQTMIDVAEFGHIVITPQFLDVRQHADADILAAARYAGVVLEKRHDGDMTLIGGAGMVWHLGDSLGHGDLFNYASHGARSWQTSMASALPAGGAITAGTYTDPATTNTKIGDSMMIATPLEVIKALLVQVDGEFKVQPDGTIDAGDREAVFNVADPNVIVTRYFSGSDTQRFGLHATRIETDIDATRFITGSIVKERYGWAAERNATTATATHSYKDIHGNALIRERAEYVYGTGTDSISSEPDLTDRFKVHEKFMVETDYYQFVASDMQVGDAFYIWDEPFISDTANSIPYRGHFLPAKSLRCLEATWPLRDGMGVYYRDSAGAYTDLTRWVAWENNSQARIICGEPSYGVPPHITERAVE